MDNARQHDMDERHGAQELIDIEKVAHAAALAVLGRDSAVRVDTGGAAFAPLALGDRRYVSEQLRRLIGEVLGHPGSDVRSGATRLAVRAWVTPEASIKVRVEAGAVWRELQLPVGGAAPLDAPRLAQIERYGFLRLAPLAPLTVALIRQVV